jgi:hypothetical protein
MEAGMTDLAHLYRVITDAQGNVTTNPLTVTVYQPGTTTVLADPLYADNAGTLPLTNPFTVSTGIVDFYLTTAQRVDLKVDDGSRFTLYPDVDVLDVVAPGGGGGGTDLTGQFVEIVVPRSGVPTPPGTIGAPNPAVVDQGNASSIVGSEAWSIADDATYGKIVTIERSGLWLVSLWACANVNPGTLVIYPNIGPDPFMTSRTGVSSKGWEVELRGTSTHTRATAMHTWTPNLFFNDTFSLNWYASSDYTGFSAPTDNNYLAVLRLLYLK